MNDNYGWGLSKLDPMMIEIRKDGETLFSIFIGEAMEGAGRHRVMKHVKACDKSPWLTKWHDDAMEQVVEILKDNRG